MTTMRIDYGDFDRLQQAMKEYEGNTEEAINEVLHEKASLLIQEEIYRLMPVSNRKAWKGKKTPASKAKSLTDAKENLAITVKNTNNYGYLYFPDDGSNTRRHAGNQHFFLRGGEAKQNEIIDLCINRLIDSFDDAM